MMPTPGFSAPPADLALSSLTDPELLARRSGTVIR